jgi:translation initiation factor IF-3
MKNNKSNSRDTGNYEVRINDRIRFSPVVVVDKDGNNLGTKDIKDAQYMARKDGLDLVEVSPGSRPPVCRIMDYSKYKYEKSIKEKNQKRNSKISQIKEIRLRPSIGKHDIDTKIKAARKFLSQGNKVQFRLQYKRRENAHKNQGFSVIEEIIEELKDVGSAASTPKLNGNNLNCLIEPLTK